MANDVPSLYDVQANQQACDFNIVPDSLTDDQRAELVNELLMGLYEEATELSRSIRIKPHIEQERPTQGNTLDGIVDVLKMAYSIAHATRISEQELYDAFVAKTAIVATRRHQFLNRANDTTVFVTDLDGCVADLSAFVAEVQGGIYGEVAGSVEIERRKAAWYEAGGFNHVAAIEGASNALHAIRAAGHRIAIITARPVWVHRRVAWDTQSWLKANNIPYDILAFGKDKYDELVRHVFPARVVGFVEDRDKHAMELAAQQVPVLLMAAPWNRAMPESEHVKRVGGWNDVLQVLNEQGLLKR